MSVRMTNMDEELCYYCRKLIPKDAIVWELHPANMNTPGKMFVQVPCHKECLPKKKSE